MNLVIANHGIKDPESWRLALGAGIIIDVNQSDKLKAFSELSIKLDELIYVNRQPVDWVLYATDEKDIQWGKFLQIASAISKVDDTIFLTDKLLGNFYCRPHVFSMLGGLYKIKPEETALFQDTRASDIETRILYAVIRSGYDIRTL